MTSLKPLRNTVLLLCSIITLIPSVLTNALIRQSNTEFITQPPTPEIQTSNQFNLKTQNQTTRLNSKNFEFGSNKHTQKESSSENITHNNIDSTDPLLVQNTGILKDDNITKRFIFSWLTGSGNEADGGVENTESKGLISTATSTAKKTASKIFNVFSSLVGLGGDDLDNQGEAAENDWDNEKDEDNSVHYSTRSGSIMLTSSPSLFNHSTLPVFIVLVVHFCTMYVFSIILTK